MYFARVGNPGVSVLNDVLKGHQLNPIRICLIPVNLYKLHFPEIQFFSTLYIQSVRSIQTAVALTSLRIRPAFEKVYIIIIFCRILVKIELLSKI